MSNIYYDNKDNIQTAVEDRLLDIVSDYVELTATDKRANVYKGKCPGCGADHGLLVTPGKNLFGCVICKNYKGKGAVSFLMKKGYSYTDSLEHIARILNLTIIDKTPVKPLKQDKRKKQKTFCESFLTASGLTTKDVTAKVFIKDENKTSLISHVFKSGTLDQYGSIDKNGDDVIIEYFDLEGSPVQYEVPGVKGKPTGKFRDYVRVRYQYPEDHRDKDGRPIKYKSPYGSGTHLYIPQKMREIYASGQKLDYLCIQEGEKKAEKSCKHGIPSVGISGIQNLAYKGNIPQDLIKIIQKCEVKEVILLFDADWRDLSSNIKFNDDVQQRPRNFFYAAKNYLEYMQQLKNKNIHLQIYVGAVQKNEQNDKGIDDLLTNTLKGKEDELKDEFGFLLNEKDPVGEYLQLHKITIWNDFKLSELWCLNNPGKFAEFHKEILKELPEFKIGQHNWRFDENGTIESTRPIESYEQFWNEIEKRGKDDRYSHTTYEFNYVKSMRFLENRGFGRYMQSDGKYVFIHVNPPTVRVVEPHEMRDFVSDFTKSFLDDNVLELLYKGGSQYLGYEKLSSLSYIKPIFEDPQRNTQIFYFKNKCWKITESDIKETDSLDIQNLIWNDQRKDFVAERLNTPLINVKRLENGSFDYSLSKLGKACHMLQFLINTSNFTWKKEREMYNSPEAATGVDPEELQENKDHLISKLCAIGYMLMTCKDRNVSRAVVAMDGKQSEVGKSNGRSGKSIIGEMFKHLLPTIAINGKSKSIEDDNFVWDELTEKIKIVFVDDVRTNFSLEFLFANITGDWTVNYKGGRRITYPFALSPKIYITTNHALNGDGSSFMDRQWLIAFSDYYNDKHKPLDDFGVLFFDEWENDQWNLLWNLVAECVQLYLRFGVVQAPGERLDGRRQRQFMGENFILWAEEYFSSSDHLNNRIVRKVMYDNFIENSAVKDRKFINPQSFKEKIKTYCEWKGYVFNPKMYDPISRKPIKHTKDGDAVFDDKSGGVEYFTVGEWEYFLNKEGMGSPTTPASDQGTLFDEKTNQDKESTDYKFK